MRVDGAVKAVAPLVASPRPGRYTLPGHGVGDPQDLSYADPPAVSHLARALADLRLPLEFPRIPAEASTIGAVKRAFRGRGAVFVRPAPSAPAIDLDPSWTEPESKLSAKRRSDLRRAGRRAATTGAVTFELTSPTPADLEAVLPQALKVEGANWKSRAGTALQSGGTEAAAIRHYLAHEAAAGRLRIMWLRIADCPAAVQIAVQKANRYCLFKVGYDEQFKRCSPGQLLLEESVRQAAAAGLDSYEFWGHSEPWTRVWAGHERECVSLRAFPANVAGAVTLGRDAAIHFSLRLRARVKRS